MTTTDQTTTETGATTPTRSTHGVGTLVVRQEGMLMPAVLWDRRFDQVLALNVDYFTAEQAEALAAVLEYPSQREFGKKQRRNYERRLRRHQQRAAEAEIAWRTAAGKAIPLRLTEAAQR